MSTETTKKRSSLRIQIGLLYTLLAFVNIIFFSVMIFSNQRDLLILNFRYQADNLVKVVQEKLATVQVAQESNQAFEDFKLSLASNNIKTFLVFDDKGKVWHSVGDPIQKDQQIPDALRRKSIELSTDLITYRSAYLKEINEKDFTVSFLLPLKGEGNKTLFLSTVLSIDSIRQSLRGIYIQIGVAVVWGVIFHVIFAIFVFNLIFKRVELLKDASNHMAGGNLKARADWTHKRNDELDELGTAFNSMAANIEEKVVTISVLNEEIQTELTIGKEVQKQFIKGSELLPKFKGQIYYRPMRQVSGDIYGMFDFPKGYTGFFFCDASGHGVSAALITTITIQNLENALKRNMNPRKIVANLNNALGARFESSYFATGIFMLFHPNADCMMTSAGHLPVLIHRPSTGDLIEVPKMGPPMGLMEDFDYPVKRLGTKSGDRILIYSDGLIETNNTQNQQFTLERTKEIFMQGSERTPEEILNDLVTQFEAHAASYRDDVSAILLEVP